MSQIFSVIFFLVVYKKVFYVFFFYESVKAFMDCHIVLINPQINNTIFMFLFIAKIHTGDKASRFNCA